MSNPSITIVAPVYNESAGITAYIKEIENLDIKNLELILVNDGSTDNTEEVISNYAGKLPIQLITLSRNFGHQSAILAGLDAAKSEIVITMDADLQHPASLIPKMLEQHQKGADVVQTIRVSGTETTEVKKNTASFFYTLLNTISDQKITPNASDFRSMNRRALDALLAMPERRKFLRGMAHWIGFNQHTLTFQVAPRVSGDSKYSTTKMIKLALHGITSFSTAPLYVSALFGLILFLLAAIYTAYVLYVRIFTTAVVEGWASVLLVQLVIGGFLSLFLGMLGLYVAAIYDEVKQRPNYIISSIRRV
jgi:glycosyltransferase involved in cell wall biosynthesis